MCRPTNSNITTDASSMKRNASRLLLTHDSFVYSDLDLPDKDDANKKFNSNKTKNPHLHGLGGPTLTSTLLTVSFYVALLCIIEQVTRLFIAQYVHLGPEILGNERNRHILARHIAVDFVPLVACAYIAITNRHACNEIIQHGLSFASSSNNSKGKKGIDSSSMHEDGYEERVFKYHTGSQRLLTVFFVYQVKNMYDTIVWGDGIEFVLHHLFAGLAAW